jgi:hypothetical protein
MHFCQFICFWVWIGSAKLKGYGNEADFLGFLQKSVPLESLTLPFEPFRIWLRIRGDIGDNGNPKTTLPLAELGSRRVGESMTPRFGESSTHQLAELSSTRLGESESRLMKF